MTSRVTSRVAVGREDPEGAKWLHVSGSRTHDFAASKIRGLLEKVRVCC